MSQETSQDEATAAADPRPLPYIEGILVAAIVLILNSTILDGGGMARAAQMGTVAYAGGVAIIVLRRFRERGRAPTRFQRPFVLWGPVATLAVCSTLIP